MERSAQAPASREVRWKVALVLLCAVVFFFKLGSRALWDVDEGMHAAMAKQVVVSGDWITPRFNGEPFLDKPMLFTWLGALSMTLFGFTEFAARLPGALLAAGTVYLTCGLGRRMFDAATGVVAGIVLATSLMFAVLARSVTHDIALTFSVTAALALFWRIEADASRRRVLVPLFWLAVGLGILAKGLLGALLPGIVIASYLLLRGRLRLLGALRPALGVAIVLLVAGPWYALMEAANPGYLKYFFIRQHLGNFVSAGPRHPEPFLYYLPLLAVGLFPWATLLPLAIGQLVRRRLRDWADGSLFLVVWVAGLLLFFSAASSKLPSYVLPLFPAVALLAARPWVAALRSPRTASRVLAWWLAPMAAACAGLLLWEIAGRPSAIVAAKYGVKEWKTVSLVVGLALVTAAGTALVAARRCAAGLAAFAAGAAAVVCFFEMFVAPDVDPYRSSKVLAAPIEAFVPHDQTLCFYRRINTSLLFYTEVAAVEIRGKERFRERIAAPRGAYCVIDQEWLPLLGPVEDRTAILATAGDKLLVKIQAQES